MRIPVVAAFLTLHLSPLAGASSALASPTTIPFRLELQLDDRPSETGWHVWSESTTTTIASRPLDHYTTPHARTIEILYLERGQTYHLVLLDGTGDGQQRSGYIALFAEEAHRDTLLLARDGSSWTDHVMLTFEVPSELSNPSGKAVTAGTPSSSSSSWSVSTSSSYASLSGVASVVRGLLEHLFRVDPYSVARYAGPEPLPPRQR